MSSLPILTVGSIGIDDKVDPGNGEGGSGFIGGAGGAGAAGGISPDTAPRDVFGVQPTVSRSSPRRTDMNLNMRIGFERLNIGKNTQFSDANCHLTRE